MRYGDVEPLCKTGYRRQDRDVGPETPEIFDLDTRLIPLVAASMAIL